MDSPPNAQTNNYSYRRNLIEFGSDQQRRQLNRIYVRDRGICQICGKKCPRDEASRDHIKSPILCKTRAEANSDTNVQLAHMICNNNKDAKTSAKLRTVRNTNRDHLMFNLGELFPELANWAQQCD